MKIKTLNHIIFELLGFRVFILGLLLFVILSLNANAEVALASHSQSNPGSDNLFAGSDEDWQLPELDALSVNGTNFQFDKAMSSSSLLSGTAIFVGAGD